MQTVVNFLGTLGSYVELRKKLVCKSNRDYISEVYM